MQVSDLPPSSPLTETIQKVRTGWFNDEIMNAYFTFLSKSYPKVGFLSSFFLHANSLQWTRTRQVLKAFGSGEINRILIPFHTPGHWTTVLIVNTRNKSCQKTGAFSVLDSLGEQKELPILREWLQKTFSLRTWTYINPFSQPHQFDSINCGPYACLYAELAAKGKRLKDIDEQCSIVNINSFRNQLLSQLEHDRSVETKEPSLGKDQPIAMVSHNLITE